MAVSGACARCARSEWCSFERRLSHEHVFLRHSTDTPRRIPTRTHVASKLNGCLQRLIAWSSWNRRRRRAAGKLQVVSTDGANVTSASEAPPARSRGTRRRGARRVGCRICAGSRRGRVGSGPVRDQEFSEGLAQACLGSQHEPAGGWGARCTGVPQLPKSACRLTRAPRSS